MSLVSNPSFNQMIRNMDDRGIGAIYEEIEASFGLSINRLYLVSSILSSLLRVLSQVGRIWEPLNFSNPNFIWIPVRQKTEEETTTNYVASRYYRARMGEIFKDRYQVVGKRGFGASSTVWITHDIELRPMEFREISAPK
ncbi:hypothetical protein CIHG_01122 [Coccidioides immitis H538.4]|uniref:Uncharacterized protein n=2 Tax=Coccidioides immitis TaxID=5501 RepID=A0A0J8RDR1_COCIT|nr:hypothetical protein CIRG_03520 [Coccidioides immitis RMSCC 2394]KMU83340.1 hypothetical protein CIHG_01122 [Coccidioides immitis H538.4]